MNLTNNNKKEKEIIVRTANDIFSSRKESTVNQEKDVHKDSYFIQGEQLAKYKLADIMAYAPDSPVEIDFLLDKLWQIRKTDDMRGFKNVCIVSAMKNRNVKSKTETASISHSVYEF